MAPMLRRVGVPLYGVTHEAGTLCSRNLGPSSPYFMLGLRYGDDGATKAHYPALVDSRAPAPPPFPPFPPFRAFAIDLHSSVG